MNMNTTRNKQFGIIDLHSVMFQLLLTVLKAMGHAGVIGLVFIAPSITTVVTLQVVSIPMVVTLIIIVVVVGLLSIHLPVTIEAPDINRAAPVVLQCRDRVLRDKKSSGIHGGNVEEWQGNKRS